MGRCLGCYFGSGLWCWLLLEGLLYQYILSPRPGFLVKLGVFDMELPVSSVLFQASMSSQYPMCPALHELQSLPRLEGHWRSRRG